MIISKKFKIQQKKKKFKWKKLKNNYSIKVIKGKKSIKFKKRLKMQMKVQKNSRLNLKNPQIN